MGRSSADLREEDWWMGHAAGEQTMKEMGVGGRRRMPSPGSREMTEQ